jgi:hypothetical protein
MQQVPDPINNYSLFMRKDCNDALETEYTHYTTPAYDIRGLTTRDLRFEYPLYDPQCQIFESFAVNTKLQAKDQHRAVWQVPFDQKDLLPVERLGMVKNCNMELDCKHASV